MILQKKHVNWQRRVIDVLKLGGLWAVPASGAIIKRINDTTVRIEDAGNDPVLLKQIVAHIQAAGFTVEGREQLAYTVQE